MERYTEKINETDYKLTKYNDIVRACARQKLGKIEDMLKAFNIETLEELEKLLEFATSYEELTNKLGCPLEVFIKLHNIAQVYDVEGKPLKILQVLSDTVVAKRLREEKTFLLFKDYKRLFWLREDKSE